MKFNRVKVIVTILIILPVVNTKPVLAQCTVIHGEKHAMQSLDVNELSYLTKGQLF